MNRPTRFSAAEFNQHLAEHKLMGARCTACGVIYAPPRPICPACPDAELEWIELSGRGELVAYTVIHIAPTMMLGAGYHRKNPYCAGVVELAEGPRVSAQILGVDVTDPASIAIGTELHATFVERGEGEAKQTHLAFETSQE
jgi:hypothetical protein